MKRKVVFLLVPLLILFVFPPSKTMFGNGDDALIMASGHRFILLQDEPLQITEVLLSKLLAESGIIAIAWLIVVMGLSQYQTKNYKQPNRKNNG